ncbi:UPF0149 family protein [Marinihelvus fidelis]|uniref:UPF0149 family protein n=1 Tax=Marinihelvus fidelis TaxID=2613842 RepID=A0A5N0T6X8_9GAMM|nr:UPF0149 family protein [Marinihelvus fidelis]KAA9130805.1 UPF0149 family protein [Marinihelvus fidelis]
MSTIALPDFDHTLALSHGNLDAAGLSECHGVACGLLVRQPSSGADAFLGLLDMLQITDQPGVALREALADLFTAAASQLADDDMGFVIWLPDDEESLEDRTEAIAQWCNGFLASIGAGDDGCLETLSDDAGEALADLKEIALAEVAVEYEDESGQAPVDDDEQAFAEIVEYIRVSVLILREDLRGPVDGDSIH